MDRNKILADLEGLLQKVLLAKKKISIRPEDRLEDDLGIDSIVSVELVTELEDLYLIEISDEAMERARTVADVVDIVLGRLALAA